MLNFEEANFGEVPLGCTAEIEAEASNIGKADLEIHQAFLDQPADALFHELPTDADEMPWLLAPGESHSLGTLIYAPTDEGQMGELGWLHVVSDDPESPDTVVTVTGQTSAYGTHDESFIAGDHQMDILLSVDSSGSMAQDIGQVIASLWTISQTVSEYDRDFRLAAVINDEGCVQGEELWIENGATATDVATMAADMLTQNATGVSYDYPTWGLGRVKKALSDEQLASGGCNDGFVRAEANLHVVGVSDAPDESPIDKGWIEDYVQPVLALKAPPFLSYFHAIGQPDPPTGSDDGAYYEGFWEATEQTGGHFLSICEVVWGDDVPDMVAAMVEGADRTTYPLSQVPIEGSIVVKVDNVAQSTGWSWDQEQNAVIFEDSGAPQLGAAVTIAYYVAGGCDE